VEIARSKLFEAAFFYCFTAALVGVSRGTQLLRAELSMRARDSRSADCVWAIELRLLCRVVHLRVLFSCHLQQRL
jgi:hypothetical protein